MTATHNNLNQPIHHTEEGVKNFHKWYGKSHLRDEHDRPIVMYHGTNSDVHGFDRVDGGNMWGHGHYFAEKHEDASEYATGFHNRITPTGNAGPNVMPVYVKSERPLHMDHPVDVSAVKKLVKITGDKSHLEYFDRRSKGRDLFQHIHLNVEHKHGTPNEILQKIGYDSLSGNSAIASRHGGRTVMVFNKSQVKSAIGNNGKFSKKTPTLHESCMSFSEFLESKK
jgi:hypothetical protein